MLDTFLYIIAALLFIFLLYLVAINPGKRSRGAKKIIPNVYYAHRGLWDKDKPENSFPAFKSAIENGFGIELDLQMTKDNHVVVFHDDDAKRMCGVDKMINSITLEEVQSLRLNNTDEKIPLLSDVLEQIGGRVPIIIEIKYASAKSVKPLCERVVALLDDYSGFYCMQSFNPLVLKWYKKHRPDIIRGQLTDAFMRKPDTQTIMYFALHYMVFNILTKPDYIAYNAKNADALPFRLVRLFRPTTIAWTIRSPEEINKKYFDRFIFECFVPDSNIS